jgi:foldase protein PrsA
MMLNKLMILVAGVVAGTWLMLSMAGCGLPEDAAASVNGVIISKDDVQHRIDVTAILFPSEVPEDRESQEFIDYRGNVTKQLVSEEIERQEAEKRGISVSPDEIEESLTIYVEDKYFGDVEKMEEAFAGQGISIDDLRAEIERDLRHEKMLDAVHEETTITDEEVESFYNENKARYVYPERRQIRQIVVPDQAAAQAAAARIAGGEDFTAVASEVSVDGATAANGGLVGMVSQDQLPADIGQRAFSLDMNSVSEPFQSGSSWYIIKVEIITPASNKTFDEIKDELSFYLRNQKFAQRWKDYSAELWDEYDIEYAEGYEPPPEGETQTTTTLDPNAPAPRASN